MNYLILIIFFIFTSSLNSQTWDSNYYDKKVLYDNADLLQLNEYEKLKLRSQEIERNKIIPKDDVDFYDLDNLNDSMLYDNNIEFAEQKSAKKDARKNYSFTKVVDQVSMETVTNNTNILESIYFIDF